MSQLLCLPFDVHVQIARNLQLKDCLAYSTLSQICHDTVYYIFSHRIQLDLGSLIVNNRLSIQSDLFLQILHAHTRATTIRNFCIPDDFTSFSELSRYFHLYWRRQYIPSYDPSSFEPSDVLGTHVGHIRGQLTDIYYLGHYGANTRFQADQMRDIITPYEDPMYDTSFFPEEDWFRNRHLDEKSNWSVINLDAPYTACSRCDLQIEYAVTTDDAHKTDTSSNLCRQCRHIQWVLSSIDSKSDDEQ